MSGDAPRRAAVPSFRDEFKVARRSVAARLALKIKLERMSDSECREVLDFIEVMQSLGSEAGRSDITDEESN